jgi:hypothetical protein
MSFLLLVVTVLFLELLQRGRGLVAGLVLSFGLLKPQLIVIWPIFLLYRREWRALVGFALGGAILGGLSLWLVGPEGIGAIADLLRQAAAWTDEYGGFDPRLNLSWLGFWDAVLANSPQIAELLAVTSTAGTIGFLLLVWRRPNTSDRGATSLSFAISLLAIPLIAQHFHFHDLVVVLPAGYYLYAALVAAGRSNLGAFGVLLVFTFIVTEVRLGLNFLAGYRWDSVTTYLLLGAEITTMGLAAMAARRLAVEHAPVADGARVEARTL